MRTLEASPRIDDARANRGAVAFIMALMVLFVIFIGVGSLALDLSATSNRGQELQSASDAASLAAVVEYEERLVAGDSDQVAKNKATDVALKVLIANGVNYIENNKITPTVTFPGAGGQVTVLVRDDTVTSVLSPVAAALFGNDDFKHGVERQATAEFLGCEVCPLTLTIPKPPQPVDVEGSGDGYKPIPVGNRFYALNHNSTSKQIVCIDAAESEPCWLITEGPPPDYEESRPAYFGVDEPPRTPEMPLTGVVEDRIYWSTSTASGHFLYCYNTDADPLLDAPCTSPIRVSTSPRGNEGTMRSLPNWTNENQNDGYKDENRGGGTFALDDKVFVFTDNHEIHCWDPALNWYCDGYNQRAYGGMPTYLDAFPDANPDVDGNNGSSIDRVIDEEKGWVYAVVRIRNAVDSHDCSARVAEPNLIDIIDETIVIESNGSFLSATAADTVVMTGLATDPVAQWRVVQEDPAEPFVYLESIELDLWFDGQSSDGALPGEAGTSTNQVEGDNQWILTPAPGGTFTLSNIDAPTGFINVDLSGDVVHEDAAATTWTISVCEDKARDIGYDEGTFVHCYNTGVVLGPPGPCNGFEPVASIHSDYSRYTGRLFFNYDPAPGGIAATQTGVCSSGYEDPFREGVPNPTEISCLSIVDGSPLAANFDALADKITDLTGNAPGAWGDPHYNSYRNRLFYPTQHNASWNLCWDFNAAPQGLCGPEFQGDRPSTPTNSAPHTEDYGFVSKGDCVFALGHTSYFWAFQALDVGEPCVGVTDYEVIGRCDCTAGATRWGALDFRETDLSILDVVRYQLTTNPTDPSEPGEVLWPGTSADAPFDRWHDIKPGNDPLLVNLDEIAVLDPSLGFADPSIRIVFYVEAQNTVPIQLDAPRGRRITDYRPRLVD